MVGRLGHRQPRDQVLILCGDADRAEAGVAVVAAARLGAHPLVVLDVDGLVAAERDHRRCADRDGVGAQRQALGGVDAVSDAAGDDQVDDALQPHLPQRRHGLNQRRHGRDAGVVHQRVGGGAGAALHAVHHDHVGAGLAGQLDVVGHAAGADLDVDGNLPVGGLAQLLDLDDQVVGPDPIGMAHGRALVNPDRQVADVCDLLRDLLAEQHAAGSRLGALADADLDGVGLAQVVQAEAVAAGQHLVDEQVRGLALGFQHAAVPGGGRGAHPRRGHAQGHLGVTREGAVAHAGDGDRRLQHERPGGTARAEDRARDALLAVALQRHAAERAGNEGQVIEVGHLLQRAPAANAVMPQLGLGLDVFDDLRREGSAVPYNASIHTPISFLEKFHKRRPAVSFLKLSWRNSELTA